MILRFAFPFIAAASVCGCAPERDGRDICTAQTVGEDTGSEIISVILLVPEYHMTGAEITNGGVLVINPDCEYTLNAFLSDETADYLIHQVKDFRWLHVPSGARVANAELYIWRFRDGSGKPRFFVGSVMDISDPKTLPVFSDEEHFQRLDNVR